MNKILRFSFIFLAAILAGLSLGTSNYLMLFGVVALAASIVVFGNIKLAIYSLILTVFCFEWLSGFVSVLPRQLTWIPDLLGLVLLCRIAFDAATKRIRIQNSFITYFVYLWLLLSIVGAIVNSLSPFVFIVGLRNYFKFVPLLLIFSWYRFPDDFVKRVVRIIVGIAVVQVLFVIPEAVIFQGESSDWGDFVVGTLGSHASGTLAVFQLIVFSMLAALYKSRFYSLRKLLIYGSLVLLPTFITEAKIVFILLPLTFMVSFLDLRRRAFARATLLVVMGAIVFTAGVNIYDSIYAARPGRDVRAFMLSGERIKDELGAGEIAYGKAGELRRLSAVNFMMQNINRDTYTKMFGVGIGNASNSLFEASKGEYHRKYPELRIGDVSLAGIGWEFGYSGLVLFAIFFFTLCTIRPPEQCGPFYDGMFRGVKTLVLIAAVCFIYNSFLRINPLAFVFWVYLGILNNRLMKQRV